MRERERIAMFTKFVQEYGVPETYTFPTESLHEKGDLSQVLVCIRGLGIEVSTSTSVSLRHNRQAESSIYQLNLFNRFQLEQRAFAHHVLIDAVYEMTSDWCRIFARVSLYSQPWGQ